MTRSNQLHCGEPWCPHCIEQIESIAHDAELEGRHDEAFAIRLRELGVVVEVKHEVVGRNTFGWLTPLPRSQTSEPAITKLARPIYVPIRHDWAFRHESGEEQARKEWWHRWNAVCSHAGMPCLPSAFR